jgi:hypothetical protein
MQSVIKPVAIDFKRNIFYIYPEKQSAAEVGLPTSPGATHEKYH